jgi:hypothetical protein
MQGLHWIMSGYYIVGVGELFFNSTDINNTKIRGARKKHQELISLIERKSNLILELL